MFSFNKTLTSSETSLLAAMLEATALLAAAAVELEKARTDDPVHPGWPAGAPDSQGGQFRPKDEDWEEVAGDIWVRPHKRPPKNSAGSRDSLVSQTAKRAVYLALKLTLDALEIGSLGTGVFERVGLEIAIELAKRAYPYVKAYFDPPKSLEELQEAAFNPQPGYDIHHLVEGSTAVDEKEAMLASSWENEVRIPTLKHWLLNGWYATKSDVFGDLSPRDYLKGKSWDERRRVGLMGLRYVGVLK